MTVCAFNEFGAVSAARWQFVQRCWALFGLLLILATWRLWMPQRVFPQVPLLSAASSLPAACQSAALACMVMSLLAVLTLPRGVREAANPWALFVFVVALGLSFLTDQHRLQPWAYQFVIYAVVFGTATNDPTNRGQALGLLRLLTLSIYFFSALGKLDYQFLHTVGQQFLNVAFEFLGIDVTPWPVSIRLLLAASFPLFELLIVIALSVPRCRRAGVSGAVMLHAGLLMVLGPWGLQHQPAVLIWNLFFITQVLVLFPRAAVSTGCAPRTDSAVRTDSTKVPTDTEVVKKSNEPSWRRWIPTYFVITVICLPLLEPSGWFDHWPSWGLYSPRNSRAIVEVHRAGLARLPAELQPYLAIADEHTGWVPLQIDEWSLATLSVPIYPQDRFQLGVAESLATRYSLDRAIRVRLLGMSDRWTGARQEQTLTGRQKIVSAAGRYRLNAHPSR